MDAWRTLGRRLIHLIGGSVIPLLSFVLPQWLIVPLLALLVVLALALETARLLRPDLNRWLVGRFFYLLKNDEVSHVTGSTYFLIASLLTFLLFPQPIAVAALLYLSVADPMAITVGRAWGRIKIGHKSLEGSLAFLFACLVVALALGGVGLNPLVGIVGAVVATLAELLFPLVDDNMSIPLVSGLAMVLAALFL